MVSLPTLNSFLSGGTDQDSFVFYFFLLLQTVWTSSSVYSAMLPSSTAESECLAQNHSVG